MKRFRSKVAIVTGGRSGIGSEIALRLHEEGAEVFTVQRSADDRFASISADISDAAGAQSAVDEVVARTGRLDVLVNNAGMLQEATVEDMSVEDWNRNLAVNLTGPFLMIRTPSSQRTRRASSPARSMRWTAEGWRSSACPEVEVCGMRTTILSRWRSRPMRTLYGVDCSYLINE